MKIHVNDFQVHQRVRAALAFRQAWYVDRKYAREGDEFDAGEYLVTEAGLPPSLHWAVRDAFPVPEVPGRLTGNISLLADFASPGEYELDLISAAELNDVLLNWRRPWLCGAFGVPLYKPGSIGAAHLAAWFGPIPKDLHAPIVTLGGIAHEEDTGPVGQLGFSWGRT